MVWGFKKKEQPLDIATEVQARVNEAVNALVANQSGVQANELESAFRTRLAAAISGGYDFSDTLHNVYTDYGYPQTLSFAQFWHMYRRFGIAKSVVDLPVSTTWMTAPVITGASEQFDRDLEKLVKNVKLWNRLKGLDLRQRVGRYAGLFIRVRDNKAPELPVEKLNGIGSVIQVIPIFEGQLKVLTTDQDPLSDDYGQPTMYQYNTGSVGSRDEQTNTSFSIHPSRLILAAEGADDGSIYGVPALEGCFNSLMDLRKVIGAGGEGFYKNAAQSIIFKLMDASTARQNSELLKKFNEQYDDFVRNPHRRGLWTPGLEPSALNASLVDPKEFFMAALHDVAANSGIPATILIGQQTGRLASNEDSRSYLSGINSRRETYVIPDVVMATIDWFIEHGVLPASEYEVEWDDLLALSDQERIEVVSKMAATNRDQFNSGEEIPFTSREIRVQAGFDVEPEDELVDPEPDPELDEEVPTVEVPPDAEV